MFIVVMLVLLSAIAGAGYYIALRLYQGAVCFFPSVRFWPVLVGVSVLTLLLILGFARGFLPFSKDFKHVLGLVGNCVMGVMLYLLLFTALADLLTLVPKLLHAPFVAHRLFCGFVSVGVLALTLLTCIGGFINARQIEHVSYEITLQGKRDVSDLNMVMISDLHLGSVGSEGRLEEIVSEINAKKPDVVCIAGDFFDTDFDSIQNPEAAIATLKKLKSTYGVYACLGNHDGGDTHGQMLDFLKRAQIELLNDEYTVIDDRLVLVGRRDPSPIGGFGAGKRKPLEGFLDIEDPTMAVVVLDHNPANIDEYGAEADLILCGHTHKGQLFPGSLLTSAMFTVDYGYYRGEQGVQAVVSSGVGYWGPPMRVGTDSEIVSIRFKS